MDARMASRCKMKRSFGARVFIALTMMPVTMEPLLLSRD